MDAFAEQSLPTMAAGAVLGRSRQGRQALRLALAASGLLE